MITEVIVPIVILHTGPGQDSDNSWLMWTNLNKIILYSERYVCASYHALYDPQNTPQQVTRDMGWNNWYNIIGESIVCT